MGIQPDIYACMAVHNVGFLLPVKRDGIDALSPDKMFLEMGR